MTSATALAAPDLLGCRPDERSSVQWQTRLAALISRGGGSSDPRVIECRAGMAFWRVAKVISAQAEQLDQAGRDLLVSQLSTSGAS
jgi:hypothetical protein